MSIEDAMRDRIHRLIGGALIEFGWQRPKQAADMLEEALYHLRNLANAKDDA